MNGHPTVLADQDRLELFALLGRPRRLFRGARTWTDDGGIAWAGTSAGGLGIALTWLGPGWVFDPAAQKQQREDYQRRLQSMRLAGADEHRRRLREAVKGLRLRGHAE